ncbi:uncharacterized protein FMAN_01529 [Fusarium mangiferae]|uniref:Uncharacterized protein n=1 Tax=Fusarium mangiferae TaxID=192010 RepID=A0A1L7SMU9_FUSMA|nr:uncharacterized protein FMAN_01529 [Fusarium mangiferae]CVK84526.1 uncharacterized protein FMAN_01529 [Fusarium mangiferae]
MPAQRPSQLPPCPGPPPNRPLPALPKRASFSGITQPPLHDTNRQALGFSSSRPRLHNGKGQGSPGSCDLPRRICTCELRLNPYMHIIYHNHSGIWYAMQAACTQKYYRLSTGSSVESNNLISPDLPGHICPGISRPGLFTNIVPYGWTDRTLQLHFFACAIH